MDIQELATTLKGKIIFPDDAEYDKARTVLPGDIDRKPKAIVRVADADDIQKTVAFAKEHDAEVTIRSGGHSAFGFCVADDGIMVDLRDMKNLEVDVTAKTAWAETGLKAGEVTQELDKNNLALGFGDTGSVGICGITLGGGVGFLVRKFGLTIDNLLA